VRELFLFLLAFAIHLLNVLQNPIDNLLILGKQLKVFLVHLFKEYLGIYEVDFSVRVDELIFIKAMSWMAEHRIKLSFPFLL
jgi:hypothetical protein